jgi:xanthine dehydrogenase accessory factor
LYIGSKTPAEIAISILSEITAVKNGVVLSDEFRVGFAKAKAQLNPGAPVCGVD